MNDAQKIQKLIAEKNWSQNKFAKETGIAQSYISYIIRGQKELSENMVKKICSSLKIDTSYFIEPKKEEDLIIEVEAKEEPKLLDEADNYKDIFEIALQITKLRASLLEKIKTERENDKKYNGIDQDFLHGIENLDNLSEKEAIDMILNERATRKIRRITKNRIFILQGLLSNMPIADYHRFAVNGYEQTRNFKYNPRATESSNLIDNTVV